MVNIVTAGLRNIKMVKKVLASGKLKFSCFSEKADLDDVIMRYLEAGFT